MRLKIILGSVVAVAVLVLVAGCGSSDSSGTNGSASAGGTGEETTAGETTSSGSEGGETSGEGKPSSSGPLTVAEFKTEGNKICQGVPANYGKLLKAFEEEAKKQGKKKPSTAEINLKAAVPPIYTAVEEFEALTPPNGEEEKVEEIISALEAAAKGLEEKPSSPLSGPESPFGEFQKVTESYGMGTCSQL